MGSVVTEASTQRLAWQVRGAGQSESVAQRLAVLAPPMLPSPHAETKNVARP